jgi:hypothetical protein
MGSLSLSSTVNVFPCPNCRETINTSMPQCPFCGTVIDHASAELSAAETSKISQACSDASYLKIMAWALIPSFLVLFVPLFTMAGVLALWFFRFAIPIMVIRWWYKFREIKTSDPDFAGARRAAVIVSVVAFFLVVDLLWIVIRQIAIRH